MFPISNIFKHFKKILVHKFYVCKYCFKFGLYFQGIIHDNSKFSPTEFWNSVKYYQGNRSPIDAEKRDKGYSEAWAHHHNKNKHHWLYWVDFDNKNNIMPMKMPYKYAVEAIADWIGAGRAYTGKNFTWDEPYEYYMNNTKINSEKNINKDVITLWETMLVDLKNNGINFVSKRCKNNYYKKIYCEGEKK